jgi:hypothetical protein
MKLIVFGATGGIGSRVVEQALAAGHEVTAIVHRSPASPIQHEHLEVMHGDVLEPANVRQSIVGKDVVISALGVRNLAPTTLFSEGLENMIQAMRMVGVRAFNLHLIGSILACPPAVDSQTDPMAISRILPLVARKRRSCSNHWSIPHRHLLPEHGLTVSHGSESAPPMARHFTPTSLTIFIALDNHRSIIVEITCISHKS